MILYIKYRLESVRAWSVWLLLLFTFAFMEMEGKVRKKELVWEIHVGKRFGLEEKYISV